MMFMIFTLYLLINEITSFNLAISLVVFFAMPSRHVFYVTKKTIRNRMDFSLKRLIVNYFEKMKP